jgi:solute carrier family 35, member E1
MMWRYSNLSNEFAYQLSVHFTFSLSTITSLFHSLSLYPSLSHIHTLIHYTVKNKQLLNKFPAPITVGTLQLGVGAIYAIILWVVGARGPPILLPPGIKSVREVGFYHGAGQLLSMVSLGAGPVSFTHIVKALEPFFSSIVSALVTGKWLNWRVYATLIPVVGGVSYACLNERSFSWLAFWMAMGSNLVFALRAVVSKRAMDSTLVGINVTPANMFAAVTIASFFMCLPGIVAFEGGSLENAWEKAIAEMSRTEIVRDILLTGILHYTGNEVMYMALGSVHPVTLAVGNTMKRVFIILASVLVFRNHFTTQTAIGSAIGIAGVLLYSITKNHYEKLSTKVSEQASSVVEKVKSETLPAVSGLKSLVDPSSSLKKSWL